MSVPFISCRNAVTGATAELPETALPHMTSWIPIAAGGETSPAHPAVVIDNSQPVHNLSAPAASARTTKSTAATTATNEKE